MFNIPRARYNILESRYPVFAFTPVRNPVSPVVAAPGSDITLGCSFLYSSADNILIVVVNWQRGNTEVVHSYYEGKDQLQKQSAAYKGHTQLYPGQLAEGNASLTLMGVQESDQGEYTCAVANEQGTFQGRVLLLVAAPYDEPQFGVRITCDGMVLSFTSMHGFPQPALLWRNKAGSDITNQSHTSVDLDSEGRYVVQSEMALKANETQTITIGMSLGVLNQSFSWSITLHPLAESCEKPAGTRNSYVVSSVVVLILGGFILLLYFLYKKYHRSHKPGTARVPIGEKEEAVDEAL